MAKERQSGLTYSSDLEASASYEKDELALEELLNAVIAKTSAAGKRIRKNVFEFTRGAKSQRTTIEITAKSQESKIVAAVRLAGSSVIWKIRISFSPKIGVGFRAFSDEVKNAAKAIVVEENEKIVLPEGGPIPPPKPVDEGGVDDEGSDDGSIGDGDVPPVPKRKKGGRASTAAAIPREAVLEILSAWMKKFGPSKITQTEFWKLIEPFSFTLNRITVRNFFERRGLVVVTFPAARHTHLELTPASLAMSKEHERRLEETKLEAKKAERLQSIIEFAKRSQSALETLQAMLAVDAEFRELDVSEKEITKKISALQTELAIIAQKRKKLQNRSRELHSSADADKIAGLLEIVKGYSE